MTGFTQLKNLVLDNNEIGDENSFPAIPALETLWINHNNVSICFELLKIIMIAYRTVDFFEALGVFMCARAPRSLPNRLLSS